ncbi:hypothetical protein O181_031252 [Austropuccinia psidii MF-1]|uniref:Uncharacterized protein n=1 Tax=Austropuccinia psidii MF-1 TaxID=1389203 RepID=A0A9Q3D0A4_9BASI|nr:hypothetical protein [Austropuccinia psidii MF-1]
MFGPPTIGSHLALWRGEEEADGHKNACVHANGATGDSEGYRWMRRRKQMRNCSDQFDAIQYGQWQKRLPPRSPSVVFADAFKIQIAGSINPSTQAGNHSISITLFEDLGCIANKPSEQKTKSTFHPTNMKNASPFAANLGESILISKPLRLVLSIQKSLSLHNALRRGTSQASLEP